MKIKRFVCNPFQENCYVVSDETNEGVIIDCGAFFPEERTAVADYIKSSGIKLKHLLATHAHIDHNFGNNTIDKDFGLKPEVHHRDEPLMAKLDEQCRHFCGQPLGYDMPPVGRYFSEDDTIEFGIHRFTIIPTPGHTPGSVFFYCEEESVAFSGDTLFRMSIGRTDFELGSYDDMMRSLRLIPQRMKPETIVLPGHGPQTTIGEETAGLMRYRS